MTSQKVIFTPEVQRGNQLNQVLYTVKTDEIGLSC